MFAKDAMPPIGMSQQPFTKSTPNELLGHMSLLGPGPGPYSEPNPQPGRLGCPSPRWTGPRPLEEAAVGTSVGTPAIEARHRAPVPSR